MIIGVDGRELEGKTTGVGVYLKNILDYIKIPQGQLQIFFRRNIPDLPPAWNAEPVLLKSNGNNLSWQQWTLCRELKRRKVSLFFSPANSLPWYYPGIQTMTIFDLSFFRNPEWFSLKERLSRQLNAMISIRRADRIYTISNYVKEEIAARFRIPASSILIAPAGVSEKKIDHEQRRVLRESSGFQNRFVIFYAGSIFNRRHVPELIHAMSRLNSETILLIAGENRTFPFQDLRKIAAGAGVSDRVRILEYLTDKTLQDYYLMADAFVYLSEYEGFGIPPLEALSFGVPVVVSATPAMDEIYRDAAFFVQGFDPASIAAAIQKCIHHANERQIKIQAGANLVEKYHWKNAAAVISSDWEQLLATGH